MVVLIFYFVVSKGFVIFFKDKINVFDFLFGINWNLSDIGVDGKFMVGVLLMIVGFFIVMFLLVIVVILFVIGVVVFMIEILFKKGVKFL